MRFFPFINGSIINFVFLVMFSCNAFAFWGFGEPDCDGAMDCMDKAEKVKGEERAAFYGKACEDYRYWIACFNAGSIYQRHVKDKDKAQKYYKIGCDLKCDTCCSRIGYGESQMQNRSNSRRLSSRNRSLSPQEAASAIDDVFDQGANEIKESKEYKELEELYGY